MFEAVPNPVMHLRTSYSAALLVVALAGGLPPASAAADPANRSVRIIQTSDAQFPAALLVRGITGGEVRAVLNIDADGKFADCLIETYTAPELAAEVLQAVRDWEYEPAYVHGEPTGTRLELSFVFEAHGTVLSLTPLDTLSESMNKAFPGRAATSLVCKATELDEPLQTRRVVRPLHPGRSLQPAQLDGSVTLDFYIDADGKPRMPVVLRATHEAFAVAVVSVLPQWRFAPPRHDGRPAVVRVQQEFVFSGRP